MQPLPPLDQPCFLDANTLYYSVVEFSGISDYCSQLLKEIAAGDRTAVTISSAMADAVHKVMFSEIVQVHKRPRQGLQAWLKKNPDAISSLKQFVAVAENFAGLPITWLPQGPGLLKTSTLFSMQHGLTVNDALIVAAMYEHGIQHLVTNDDDFDNIPGITVWKPR